MLHLTFNALFRVLYDLNIHVKDKMLIYRNNFIFPSEILDNFNNVYSNVLKLNQALNLYKYL